jgi:SWI/SNF related-matrix-associated actin-dependent regulator of chromatin subfamily C
MPWVKCEGTFYHCIKHPDIRLCVRAFSEGCFPSGSSAKDFVKVEAKPHASASDDGWTSQETLLLLEGLTSYGEKWGRIAELIGSKSRLDCLIKFASLPIKEHFADALAAKALLVPFSAALWLPDCCDECSQARATFSLYRGL